MEVISNQREQRRLKQLKRWELAFHVAYRGNAHVYIWYLSKIKSIYCNVALVISTSSSNFTTTNRRISMLNKLPKIRAMSVLLIMITLYGMLKSGVARSTSKADV